LTNNNELNISIGTDIVELERFRSLETGAPFYDRIFSTKELEYCRSFTDPSPHFATTFAGKEAVLKATSSNCRAILKNIEILRDEDGAPYVILHQNCNHNIFVSLSYSSTHAVAVALAVSQSQPSDANLIEGLLEETVKKILPRSEVS
jgi:holo-[acyl-carrier protein] synthase